MLAVHWSSLNAAGRRVFTANLNVDYRRPLPAETRVCVRASVVRVDRRKLFIDADVVDSASGVVFAEAHVLYLVEAPAAA
jgi:acyl-CoA thioesterase FadM